MAEELLKDKKPDWAVAVCKLGLQEYKLPSTYTKLGKAYLAGGQKQRAREAYQKAVELWPENAEARKALEGLK